MRLWSFVAGLLLMTCAISTGQAGNFAKFPFDAPNIEAPIAEHPLEVDSIDIAFFAIIYVQRPGVVSQTSLSIPRLQVRTRTRKYAAAILWTNLLSTMEGELRNIGHFKSKLVVSIGLQTLYDKEYHAVPILWSFLEGGEWSFLEGGEASRERVVGFRPGKSVMLKSLVVDQDGRILITLGTTPRGLDLVAHLLNFSSDKRLSGAQRLQDFSAVHGIRVRWKCTAAPRSVSLVPEKRKRRLRLERWLGLVPRDAADRARRIYD